MKTYILDGNAFHDAESFYDTATDVFGLPACFGRNLDALSDCLGEIGEPFEIVWENSAKSQRELGNDPKFPDFFGRIVEVLEDIPDGTLTLK